MIAKNEAFMFLEAGANHHCNCTTGGTTVLSTNHMRAGTQMTFLLQFNLEAIAAIPNVSKAIFHLVPSPQISGPVLKVKPIGGGRPTQCAKIPAMTSAHGDVMVASLGDVVVRMSMSSEFQYLAPSPLGFMTRTRKIHVSPTVRAPRTTIFLGTIII